MLQNGQNWELFGYDMRQLGRHWVAAWRDLLWSYDSPLRARLDDIVTLQSDSGERFYHGGQVTTERGSVCAAVLLPDDLVLTRSLKFPVAVESDLHAALALEVNANSPFSSGDTGWGWRIASRDENFLHITLVIVSLSATMAYLGQRFGSHDVHAQEVWAEVNDAMIVVHGFGEKNRETRYQKRLQRCAVLVLVGALLLAAIAGVAALSKRLELQRLQGMSKTILSEAADASRMRESLTGVNETIAAANRVVALYPNPHTELSRLTHLLGDGASVVQFTMRGNEIRLRGRAVDAASVMQELIDQQDYAEVTAPQAITRLGNTGLEQFYLDIRLREDDAG